MLDVEQEIVEAYFESNGFLVRQAGKPDDSEDKKKTLPLPTIAVFNPAIQSSDSQLSFRLFTGDLRGVRSALVSRLGCRCRQSDFAFLAAPLSRVSRLFIHACVT